MKRNARRTISLLALILAFFMATASAQTFIVFDIDDSAFDYYSPNTTVYNHSTDRYGKTAYVTFAMVDNRLIVALSDIETPGSLRLAKTLAHLPLSRLTGVDGEYTHSRGELRDTLVESVTFLRGGGLKIVFTDAKLHEVTEAYQRFFSDHGFENSVHKSVNANGRNMSFQNGVSAAQVNVARNGSTVTVHMTSR